MGDRTARSARNFHAKNAKKAETLVPAFLLFVWPLGFRLALAVSLVLLE